MSIPPEIALRLGVYAKMTGVHPRDVFTKLCGPILRSMRLPTLVDVGSGPEVAPESEAA